jgi:hypothetical protein
MARKKKEEPTTPQTTLELAINTENQTSEENISTTTTDENEWSSDVETILKNIQQNCSLMSKHHKKRYLMLKGKLIYFRIPLIVLGSANSVFAVGLTAYLPQQNVSVINCMLSLVCTIITSIELFLGIQSGMEKEYVAQREFYLVAVDLYSALNLERHHRTMNGKRYLEKILSQYNKLIESSEVVRTKMEDKLLPVISLSDDPESSQADRNKNLASNV